MFCFSWPFYSVLSVSVLRFVVTFLKVLRQVFLKCVVEFAFNANGAEWKLFLFKGFFVLLIK